MNASRVHRVREIGIPRGSICCPGGIIHARIFDKSMTCFGCATENPQQAFCGACGAPLPLADFLAKNVKDQITASTRDRNVVETESAIRVFEKVFGWVKIFGTTAAILLTLVGLGIAWKVTDFQSGVEQAKQMVLGAAKTSREEIASASRRTLDEVNGTSSSARSAISAASATAGNESKNFSRIAGQTKAQMLLETLTFRQEVTDARAQLQVANKLQPEMAAMREELSRATRDIKAQQQVLASSEEFAKTIFASHTTELFRMTEPHTERYAILPPPTGGNRTVVFIVLKAAPIAQTIQVQWHLYAQPADSFFNIHNLIVFMWGDPPGNLKTQELSVAYFPDKSDKELIHSLSMKDGRAFADRELLPKFNQPDPDFKGNKWLAVKGNAIVMR
jgi:hypothetical protein